MNCKNLLLLCLLLLNYSFAGQTDEPSTIPDESTWITFGADAVNTIREEFEARQWPVLIQEHSTNQDVMMMHVTEEQMKIISHLMHEKHRRCGGYIAHESYDKAVEAAHNELYVDANKQMAQYTLDRPDEVNAVLAEVNKNNILSTITELSNHYNRYYTSQTAVDAANWLRDHWQSIANNRSDVSVSLYNHSNWAMPSVIMTITGAHCPDEIVVMGGHLDSININNSSGSAPGADDNASGIACLTEAVRAALANGYVPSRTIKIIGYAAEEVGLRGSKEIANAAANNGDNIVGVMQLDMTAYKGSTQDIWLMTDYTNSALNSFVGNLIDTYTNYTRNTDSCGYACSDHASWHNAGFPATMPFESATSKYNPNIHTSSDTLQNADSSGNHSLKFAHLAAAYLVELGKGGLNGDAGTSPCGTTDPGNNELQNGDSVTIPSIASKQWEYFYIAVPSGASNLTVSLSGNNGDADIYVRKGAQPTTSASDCKGTTSNSNESCTIATLSADNYHIGVHAYSAVSNVTLSVSYDGGGTQNEAPAASFTHSVNNLSVSFSDTSTDSDGSIASRSWNFGDNNSSTATNPSHTYSAAGTYTVTLTVTDNDGATDSASKSVTVTSGDPPPTDDHIKNGETVSNLSAGKGEWLYFTTLVPANASNLNISISGGSGDADLYTSFNAQPGDSTYNCRPYKAGNTESCNEASPSEGVWHIGLKGYESFSGVSLSVSWDEDGGNTCGDNQSHPNLSGNSGRWQHFSVNVPACATSLSVSMSGGSGDADLYTRFGSQPTSNSYECRPYKNGNSESCNKSDPQAGTWYVSLYGYSNYSGVNLNISYE